MMNYEIQCVFFHVNRLDTVSRFKDLNHILECNIHFKVLFAKSLKL